MQMIVLLPVLVIAASLAFFAAPLFLYIMPLIIVGLVIAYFHDKQDGHGSR